MEQLKLKLKILMILDKNVNSTYIPHPLYDYLCLYTLLEVLHSNKINKCLKPCKLSLRVNQRNCALKSTAQEMKCCRTSLADLRTDLAPLRVLSQSKTVSLH